jgi:hypothetical protein
VSLAYVLPEAIVQVNQEILLNWGRSFDEALDTACYLLQMGGYLWNNTFPGVWTWQDKYAASRLVLTDAIQALDVQGAHVAMVPNRDTLIVTGSEDERGLEHMAILAEKALDHGRAITGFAFLLENGTWLPWLPDANHRLHDQLHLWQLKSLGRDYAREKDLLDAFYMGEDIPVAPYLLREDKKTGKTHSICPWNQGVDTLLPQAEVVYFCSIAQPECEVMGWARWDRVKQVVGHLMKRREGYPIRYWVSGLPTPEEYASIGMCLDGLDGVGLLALLEGSTGL